jgi:hypothetical protein
MLWVDAWAELFAILGKRTDFPCVLPDYREAAVEECKGWLQYETYKGAVPHVTKGWWKGRPAAIASSTLDSEMENDSEVE